MKFLDRVEERARLTELGLIAKDIPFSADEKSKKSFYRISDQFLDFWYTYVWPNWLREDFLQSGGEIDVLAESEDGKTLVVGEAKLSLTKREAEHALSELKAK